MVIKTREPGEAFKRQFNSPTLNNRRRTWREEPQVEPDVSATDEASDSLRSVEGASGSLDTLPETQVQEHLPSIAAKKPATQPSKLEGSKKPPVKFKAEGKVKKKLLIPGWQPDFDKDYLFISHYLSKHLGTRHAFANSLYLSLYEKAKASGSITVHATREDILIMVQTKASSTVTRAIELGESHGLFERQVFSFASEGISAGSYFHLKFPWKNNQ